MAPERGIAALRVLLGALFATALIDNLLFDRYTADGYAAQIDRYAGETNAPGFWSDGVMGFIADNSALFAPLQFVTELAFTVLLVLGVATGAVALAAAGFFFTLWISQLGIFWVWELLSITAIAAVVGLTTLPQLMRSGSSLRVRLLGDATFGGLGLPARLAVAAGSALALAGAVLAAESPGGGQSSTVAWRSALLFGVLLVACAFLDRLREKRNGQEPPGDTVDRERS